MKIVVCIKAVKKSLVETNSFGYIINPYDLFSLMCALDIKKKDSATEVVCLLMGGSEIKSVVQQCYALGADEVIWITDIQFAGSDTVATSYILTEAIKRLKYTYIFCGRMAVDGETGQVPYGIANRLHVSYHDNITEILDIKKTGCIAIRQEENAEITIEIEAPSVLIFDKLQIDYPMISLLNLKKSQNKVPQILNAINMGIDKKQCGLQGSKTKVVKVEEISYKRKNKMDIITEVNESISLLISIFNTFK